MFLGNPGTRHLAAVVRGAPKWDGRTHLPLLTSNPNVLRALDEETDSYLRALDES